MTDGEAKRIVETMLQTFRANDSDLIVRKVNERSLTHKLAGYLQSLVPEYHVDCEYNRSGEKPKYILTEQRRRERINPEALKSGHDDVADFELKRCSTYPDIIVHERDSNARNTLIIEAKVDPTRGDEDWDVEKLKAFTEQDGRNGYRYTHGVFVALRIDSERKAVWALRWFADGQEVAR
jgi:hypothetical protein